jgi:hypothetical protein
MAKRRTTSQHPSKAKPSAGRPYAPGYGIVDSKDGKGLLPWSWVGKKLRGCHTFWLATIYAGQERPHVMPLWGVWVEDSFFFSTGAKSRKGQNLAANAACTVTNDDGREAVVVEGIATKAVDPGTLQRVATAYKKKYQMDPRSMGEPIFQVKVTRVFGLVEKTFSQSATRWKL